MLLAVLLSVKVPPLEKKGQYAVSIFYKETFSACDNQYCFHFNAVVIQSGNQNNLNIKNYYPTTGVKKYCPVSTVSFNSSLPNSLC